MTLDDFIEKLKSDADKFKEFYQHGIDTTDYFDPELDESDWFEQFIFWAETGDENHESDV